MTPRAAGRLGLSASAVSTALTFAVAVAGPSLMEPALPGPAGQPPWSFAGHPSPYLVVALTVAALAAGTLGLALTIGAARRGWSVPPLALLGAGIAAAAALTLVPPFGSSDHLSYAAYGRMVVTGHNPYTTTPAQLARLGDPVARAVQDWRGSPSVYGALASAGQALAAWIGAGSVRRTVFVLSLLNTATFALTGLLLHRLFGADRTRQLRAALLWTLNPLLLQVLVAGAHVDSQAVLFAVAALVVFLTGLCPAGPGATGLRPASLGAPSLRTAGPAAASPAVPASAVRLLLTGAAAGLLVGLGFAVKLTMVLAGLGLLLACLLAWWDTHQRRPQPIPAVTLPAPAQFHSAPAEPAAEAGPVQAGHPAPGQSRPNPVAQRRPGPRTGGAGSQPALPRGAGPWWLLGGLAAGFAVTAAIALAVWGPSALRPALHAGSYVSIGSPWRAVRSALRLATGEAAAETVVKTAAVVLGVLLLALLIRALRRPTPPAGSGLPALPPVRAAGPAFAGRAAALAPVLVLAVAVAWLFAWPYVLPWYDALGWALLAVVPWSRLDYLLLARTAALAAGYLPARGIALPAGLGWLETVVRTALTPLALLAVLLVLLVLVWPRRTVLPGAAPDSDRPGRARGRAPRLTS